MFRFFTGKDTRGSSLKLAKKYCRLNTRSNFSNSLDTTTWNSLCDSFMTASSIMINAFKNRLDAYTYQVQSWLPPLTYYAMRATT